VSGSFLEEVVAHVIADSRAPTYARGVPAERLRSPPSFAAAIRAEQAGGALVVEYKRASPGSAAPLPDPRSPEEFVEATEVGGVVAYSCLATAHRFDGAPGRVAEFAALTARPVLFKEFVVNRRQLEVAARTGAAAVLLIARLAVEGLLTEPLADLAAEAHARGLEVLLELHDPAELSLVDGVEANVYGVNTRDLSTLAFERSRAYETIAGAALGGLRPLLGLSGVERPSDAQEFWSRGCDGLLVGTAVARSQDPASFLSSLRRPERGPS